MIKLITIMDILRHFLYHHNMEGFQLIYAVNIKTIDQHEFIKLKRLPSTYCI